MQATLDQYNQVIRNTLSRSAMKRDNRHHAGDDFRPIYEMCGAKLAKLQRSASDMDVNWRHQPDTRFQPQPAGFDTWQSCAHRESAYLESFWSSLELT